MLFRLIPFLFSQSRAPRPLEKKEGEAKKMKYSPRRFRTAIEIDMSQTKYIFSVASNNEFVFVKFHEMSSDKPNFA